MNDETPLTSAHAPRAGDPMPSATRHTTSVDSGATLVSLIEMQARRTPDAAAILAPGRAPLTYERLAAHLTALRERLAALGIGRSDRVAVVLPAGPEMATCLLALASASTCIPLNPDYTAAEFARYLEQLRPTALLAGADTDTAALGPAHERGLRVVELAPTREAAGTFELRGSPGVPCEASPPHPDDVALVLQTSGTTGRAKMVPLTHANLTFTARNIAGVLRLDERDVCLNVMPLFHIHGFSLVLATLITGGGIVCAPGFYVTQFFDWVDEFAPTWYSAAPTIHQAVLARAEAHPEVIARSPLRFIRSASSGMPCMLIEKYERTFGVPVIEAYGMTEAAPMISSNPLPPGIRKVGSVGRAAGPEIAILDGAGEPLPAGSVGEVAVRGATITAGYEDDPEANASAFVRGWLRTGDEGYLDEEGYLFITGRVKEMINRGGEKIAPPEVDAALLTHPAVAEAAAFALPHPTLGEEVAAAVVLRPGERATEEELSAFVAERLAYFKVPRRIALVAALPRGDTAKLRRHELAALLGNELSRGMGEEPATPSGADGASADHDGPRTPIEQHLVAVWSDVLEVEHVGIHDDFFALGGDSMLAMLVISRLSETAAGGLTVFDIFEAPTIADLAARITDCRGKDGAPANGATPGSGQASAGERPSALTGNAHSKME